ncbi:hypothetical protein Pcac1_g13731 [Phytophthora cactorum]|nr:hypothetical protein Pcac1_g13731 [Phytophthora cactorum]
MYTAPYVTIVQRLGFGKSRILYQVAQKLAEPSAGLPESYAFDARLLFVCPRTNDTSTFPASTPALTHFFFGHNNI